MSARRTVHKITTFEYPSPLPSLPNRPTGTLIDTSSHSYRVSQRLESTCGKRSMARRNDSRSSPCNVYQVTPGSETSFASCRARRIEIMYQFPPSPPSDSTLSFIGSAAAEKRFRDGAVLQMGEKVSPPEKVIIMWSVRLDLMGNQ